MIKRILVCGAGGFIGSHLVNKLVEEGFYVRGVDLKEPEWSKSKARAARLYCWNYFAQIVANQAILSYKL